MQSCILSVAQCLSGQTMDIVAQAVSILRDISSDNANWSVIKQHALSGVTHLLQIGEHLENPHCDSVQIIVDACQIVSHMAVLEEHCHIILQKNGIGMLSHLISLRSNPHIQQRFRNGLTDTLRIVVAALGALAQLCLFAILFSVVAAVLDSYGVDYEVPSQQGGIAPTPQKLIQIVVVVVVIVANGT